MKKYYLGIDLGSTTSKAIIIDEHDKIVGRGITNTRANYKVATEIAKQEAIFDARFTLLAMKLEHEIKIFPEFRKYIEELKSIFQYGQVKRRLEQLNRQLIISTQNFTAQIKEKIQKRINEIINKITPEIHKQFLEEGLGSKNQFFRDMVSEKYSREVNVSNKEYLEFLMLAFDKSITPVENEMLEFDFAELIQEAMEELNKKYASIQENNSNDQSVNFDAELNLLLGNYKKVSDSLVYHIALVAKEDIHIANMVGTGYGRALLPFPEDCIKSEILCHAYGAHAIFPGTRTVLDIGGQDTKAIQVDSQGLVTSFHMNDRCAAGCGRYLGYIADEFNISLNELGPSALSSEKETNICSTCTVFAGTEVRELLNAGEKKEDILAGLHNAIVMRAMSLIARSGGVKNEFTFTGGVARNQAVLKYVSEMVTNSYGKDIKINIHPDSIFMGSLGAALFARWSMKVDLPSINKNKVVKVSV